MTDAILLVGHGTRNETGQRQFVRLAERLRAAVKSTPLEVAYIELQPPSIADALVNLHAQGHKNIILSPALLFAAGHAKQDIPAAVAEAKLRCIGLEVKLAEPLGCHTSVLDLAGQRVLSSLAPSLRGESRGEGPAVRIDSATSLVVIGRGSSDPAAIAHCREFAQRLADRLSIKSVLTGFIAIAQPSLREALDMAAASGTPQIIVVPHLLFTGEMLETTSVAVQAAQRTHSQLDWRQAEILGSDLLDSESVAALLLVDALRARLSR